MTDVLVGVDVGTTSCKAAIVSLDGAELAHGRRPTPWSPVPTGAETEARALADAAIGAAHDALDIVPEARPVAVGVCSMGETGFLIDDRGEPLTPGIAWHDRRGQEGVGAMAAALGNRGFVETTGLPLSPAWTICKYPALRSRLPKGRAGRRWLGVAEWVVHALGGAETAEPSLASRTGFLDVRTLAWWPDALEWAGASVDLMPVVREAGAPCGHVTASQKLRGAVLTVAGHDHPCASLGVGATRDGDVLNSCGTAEAVLRAVRPPVPVSAVTRAVEHGLTFGAHVLPGRRALFGFFKAGLAFRRFLDLMGVEEVGQSRAALDESALSSPAGARGLKVLNIAGKRAALAGIGEEASPGLAWRAALEAGARETKALMAAIEDVAGPPNRVVVAGGWARSRVFRDVKRQVIGEFDYPSVVEAGARGAALFAGVAAGTYQSVDAAPSPRHAANDGWPEPGE